MIRIGLINGSLRRLSNNTGLGRIILGVKPNNIDIVTLKIDDLPLINQDLEVKSNGGKVITLPPQVDRIRQTVRSCRALIFTSPEYNSSVTAPLKNAYDWLSRDYTRGGSPNATPVNSNTKLGIVGGSYISQGAIQNIRRMVEYNKLNVFKDHYYTKLGKSFDAQGNLANNNEERQRLINWAHAFFKWVAQTQSTKL